MNAPRNLLSRAPIRAPAAFTARSTSDGVLAAVVAALAGMTDKHLQEQVQEQEARADALQEQLAASQAAIEAVRGELATCTAQMSAMASQHVQDMREAEVRHTAALAGIRVDAPETDFGPAIEQMSRAVGVSLSAITNALEKMDMRVSAMQVELAAMPAPPTELEFDVLDDGAGGNVRIVARAMR